MRIDHDATLSLLCSGYTYREVASLLHCTVSAVGYIARAHGHSGNRTCQVSSKRTSGTPRKRINEVAILELLQRNISHAEIAKQVGCSKASVNKVACKRNGTYRKVSSDRARRRLYGLDQVAYARLVLAQKGSCAICGADSTSKRTRGSLLFVDHDHSTGKVRGLLCHCCNVGIGILSTQAYLARGIQHLRQVLWVPEKVTKAVGVPPPEMVDCTAEGMKQSYENGATITELCRASGLSRAQVHARLVKTHTTMRPRGAPAPLANAQPDDPTLRRCSACENIYDLTNFRTLGVATSYYCKECYYEQYWIRYKYGLPAEIYRAYLTQLQGRCPVLGCALIQRPVVDHCHVTGAVRGLLSRRANLGIGLFEDNPEHLLNAYKYLETNKCLG